MFWMENFSIGIEVNGSQYLSSDWRSILCSVFSEILYPVSILWLLLFPLRKLFISWLFDRHQEWANEYKIKVSVCKIETQWPQINNSQRTIKWSFSIGSLPMFQRPAIDPKSHSSDPLKPLTNKLNSVRNLSRWCTGLVFIVLSYTISSTQGCKGAQEENSRRAAGLNCFDYQLRPKNMVWG